MHGICRSASALRVTFLLGALFLFSPTSVFAADLLLDPSSGSFTMGKDFQVKVTIDPSSQGVNAADGTVTFDKDLLSVSDVTKEKSVFSLWTADPVFSNDDGTVNFSGGTPTAFTKQGTVMTITFTPKKKGTAKVAVTKGSVLAADGKGTNVFGKGGTASFDIADAAAAAPDVPVEDAPANGPLPVAPDITSSSHAKPDVWYGTSTVTFSWKPAPDTIAVRVGIADKDDVKPTTTQKVEVLSATRTGVHDGISYLLVQFKNDSGWGDIGKKKIQIDTAPPDAFEVALVVATDNKTPPKFSFKTQDALSGLDHYDIMLDGTSVGTIKLADIVSDTYPVPPNKGGDQKVTIRAFDKAGNLRESTKQMTLPKVDKPIVKDDGPPPAPIWTLERILLIVCGVIFGMLISWIMSIRKAAAAEKSKLLKLVAEVGDKNDRVFSAMREEFEQMVKDFDAKPQLTPQERDLLENIKEVLDISQELLYGGIEALKKMIRG